MSGFKGIRSHKTKACSVGGTDRWASLYYNRVAGFLMQVDLGRYRTTTMQFAPVVFLLASSMKIVSGAGMF